MSENKYTGFEIAVIGIACRVPGASNWREYWNNLKNNIESVKFLSEEELYELGVTDDVIKDKNFVGIGSDLKDKDCFDSSFFDYTPDEARLMNPEHRFFHECAWEALEDAGYNPDTMPGPVGIYAGAGVDVNWQAYSMFMNGNKNVNDFYLSKINNKDYLTSLVSYKLNLKGPSYYVHTACSTSLVAVHVACKALLFGEARVALAGGTAISSWKNKGYMYQEGGILSKDGHCRPFDKDSSGTIAGDGVGVVVLKRLSDAIKDGDQIYSIIKGSAVNNDGKRKVGYTAPSIEGQVECIRTAQKFAKVEPETISYVETHGTATKLGDSIEVEALNIAFKRNHNKHCSIGSVKSNIGHLDSAAGVAGLIKTILSLKYNKLPATLHFNAPDSEIDFNDGPFYVNTELKDWKRENNLPLRAGINSFGVGGTNVHVILEEPPIQVSGETQPRFNLFTISAKTESSLNRYVERMKTFLEDEGSDINPADLCYTLQVGRKDFSFRKALAFTDIENLKNILRETDKKQLSVKSKDRRNSLVFMFPGQGSQYENMGKDLYENEIFFKTEMDKGFLLLEKITSLNFKTILYPDLAGKDQINETRYTQPLIFLFEYALARLIMSYGINPQYMIGHSIGEYVAACLSGVFSFEDALKLVVKRGELMNKLPEGVMVSVLSSADSIKEYLTDDISIAALNGPEQIVLSGTPQHINLFLEKLDNNNITYVKLRTSHAFHSQMLDPMLNEFKNELMKYKLNKPTHAFISNLTGKLITDEEAVSPEYWVKHVRQTVNFSDGVKFLLSQSNELLFIESGAGHSLSSLLKQQQNNKYTPVSVNLVRSVKEKENDEKFLINSIGKLWAHGITFNWNSYYKNETRRRISLPTYSFEPIKYTAEVDPFESGLLGGNIVKSKRELKDWIYYPSWKRSLLAPQEAVEKNKTFLVFSGEQPFFNSVINGLTNSNSEAIEICTGTGFLKHHKYKYSLDPLQPSQIKQLFSELLQENTEISDIVYAFAASSLKAGELELNEQNVSMNIFHLTFINIIKELVNNGVLKDQKITIVTNELYTVYGNEKINPDQSLLIGLINSLSQEHGLTCVNIDISLNQNSDLVTNLVAELNRKYNVQERIISLRGNYRWVYEYQNNLEYTSEKNNTIKNNNTYLITGGLGNMGFLLAKHLIANYDIQLILVGRTIINNNNEKNARLQHLRSISNKVNYFSTDISDSAKFEECIKDIEDKFGAINGIVHVAGNVDRNNSELVSDITWQKSFNVFSAKIKGIENIYKVFKSRNLDFVWATSSLASALGGISFGAYSSANLFMENFIASKTAEIPNWKCIALPVVIFDEQNLKNEKERSFLKADELINLFEWSVQLRSTPVVHISVNDLYSVTHKAYSLQKEIYIEDDLTNVNTEKVERPNLNNAFLEATTDTEHKLKEIFENLFGIEGIGIEDNFFDLGGDSLKGTILLKRINNVFNVEIALNELFTAPTIFEMAKILEEKLWINTEVKTVNEIII